MRIFKPTGKHKNLLPKKITDNLKDSYTITITYPRQHTGYRFVATNQRTGEDSLMNNVGSHNLNKVFSEISYR